MDVICDYNFNIFNSESVRKMLDMGCEKFTLSPELKKRDIYLLDIPPEANTECIVYGRIPVMNLAYCPAGKFMRAEAGNSKGEKCENLCREKSYALRDRISAEFPVIPRPSNCGSIILNSKKDFLYDKMNELSESGVKTFRFHFFDESIEEIEKLLKSC